MFRNAFALVCAVTFSSAFAQEATPDTWMAEATSVASRTEVRAEAAQLRQDGKLAIYDNPGYLPTSVGSLSRAQVVAELQFARRSGELSAIAAEAFDFASAHRHMDGIGTRVAHKR